MTGPVAGVLLAGGAGRRFGGGKLLHPLQDGSLLGVLAWQHMRAALDWCVVVVRAGDDELGGRFRDAGAQVVVSATAALGMGHSLASGVEATAAAAGWVIGLADMPNVRPATIHAVATEISRGARIALPVFRGERGHPAGFAASLRPELLALSGDMGARTLVQRYADEVVRLEVDDPGIIQDVDTRDDLARVAPAPPDSR